MFKKIFRKEKFPTMLFVVAALSTFALIVLIFLTVSFGLNYQKNKIGFQNTNDQNKYFLKDFKNDDQFITKNPTLKNLLAGPIISANDPSLGNDNSDVNIVYFSDFECKFCQNQEKILKMAAEKYKLKLIWKDYPESDINSKSFQASIAGRCAQRQNKFWPYHDLLFANAGNLNRDYFIQTAKNLFLDIKNFTACLDSQEAKDLIISNMQEADGLNITGIPFIYVNDQEIMGEISFDDLSKIIKAKSK